MGCMLPYRCESRQLHVIACYLAEVNTPMLRGFMANSIQKEPFHTYIIPIPEAQVKHFL